MYSPHAGFSIGQTQRFAPTDSLTSPTDFFITTRTMPHISVEKKSPALGFGSALSNASRHLLSQQFEEGYWWYTLEANESINASSIFLSHWLGVVNTSENLRLAEQIERSQRSDGSWPLYFGGPGDLSTSIECYLALKLCGFHLNSVVLKKARQFILKHGGLSQCRVFTRIHLALFGILPWKYCPHMPVSFMLAPDWLPVNIYEFSSWARACIVPLLIILHQKKSLNFNQNYLDELIPEGNVESADWSYKTDRGFLSLESFFINLDRRFLGFLEVLPTATINRKALDKCEDWVREHIARTEDIFPAMAYSALALSHLGNPPSDPTIEKCLKGLKRFQMPAVSAALDGVPQEATANEPLYQQCCISPVWDTPWAGVAILEAGAPADSPALLKAGRWLISKQILDVKGDWAVKNPRTPPGGWSFEFENDYFPDVDDTIEVLQFLHALDLPSAELKIPAERGLQWLLSMQCKNGGWAAFDVDNTKEILNRIPFADHGACLDPPSPDITGRMLELLGKLGYRDHFRPVREALHFLEKNQEKDGSWWGRWGVDYLYGTWCVLQGLKSIGYDLNSPRVTAALDWLESIQNQDGGFGEDCRSYVDKKFVPLGSSVPSQTAWALMGLIAGGRGNSNAAHRAAEFLLSRQNSLGVWDEEEFTGTGFPGHFYIRYHGYRHYFPLLALAKYEKVTRDE